MLAKGGNTWRNWVMSCVPGYRAQDRVRKDRPGHGRRVAPGTLHTAQPGMARRQTTPTRLSRRALPGPLWELGLGWRSSAPHGVGGAQHSPTTRDPAREGESEASLDGHATRRLSCDAVQMKTRRSELSLAIEGEVEQK